jgi:signal transduction histidine kinase
VVVASADASAAPRREDVALLADVSHRVALALEHVRLLEEATTAARAREEFLHVASHELRAPIATVRLAVHLLRREVRAGDAEGCERRLRVLDRQVARLLGVSETLLDVSRITAGRLELVREDGDLAALVREVALRFADDAAEQGSAVEVDAPGPVRCALDPSRMDQVISNLVSNAVKYGRGEPIRVAVRAEGGRAIVEVRDGGIGIAPEHQERIFGRFERAVSSRNYAGLGLGLWIARRLVEAHGGTIRVRSAPGAGSTFTIELPLAGG